MTIKETEQVIHLQKGKKSLDELLASKEVITGKEVIHNLKELEKRQKEFEESVEVELRNRRGK
ncbi:hypothetical protein [Polynucleobacter sp. Tro8-14-1]|uniref:hypothetical protein n=1 Tax=Polynucleobacter sp. Tro8-14-1 TaxID=1758383 RepID=UPI001C0D326D|nr:hypothetical protein [Polynucleobacter sp. Tro8-14-1]MBU3563653.1 hypothetical protein [Polynucleobacter sp. Tro8-14-1]